MRSLLLAFCLLAPAVCSPSSPSESALRALAAHGIESAAEAAALGLDTADLRELGVENVADRIAILKQKSDNKGTAAATVAAGGGGGIGPVDTRQDFHFVASYVNTTRQWGKCINIIVKYRYPRGVYSDQSYIDYRQIRELALYYAEPTEKLPVETQWELVNMAFVKETFGRWNITGISSQIQVMSEWTAEINEPGNHGSTVTHGDMQPMEEPWVNNFLFDCTKYDGQQQTRVIV